jgi:hypothetical protein
MSGPDFSAPREEPGPSSSGPTGPTWPSPFTQPGYHPVPPAPYNPQPPPGPPAPERPGVGPVPVGPYGQAGYGPAHPAAYVPGPPSAPAQPTGPMSPGGPYGTTRPARPMPAAIPVTICMTVTAGLLWPCALAAAWLLALAGEQELGGSNADLDIRTVLLLNHFSARLLDGLAWPLFGFPLVAVVLAFLLVIRRPWPRIAYTAWGALTLGWLAWWLQDNLLAALSPAVYIAVAVLLVWLPSVTAWLAQPDPHRPDPHRPDPRLPGRR